MNLIYALILTILIEFIVYALFIRKDYFLLLFYSVLINSITNPIMNFFLGFGFNLLLLEFFVFISEIFLIKYLFKINYKLAIIISITANVASLVVGLLNAGHI